MATAQVWAKSKLFIGSNVATLAAEAAWVEIKGWKGGSVGGSEFQVVDTTSVDDDVEQSIKGARKLTDMQVPIIANNADPGQIAVKAALEVRGDPYNFKIEQNDDAASAGNNPTKTMFKAHVLAFSLGPVGRNNVIERSLKLSPQTVATEVLATA